MFTLPVSAKIFVPGLFGVPTERNHSDPLATMSGTLASVSTLLSTEGFSHKPATGGKRRPRAGLAALALDGAHEGRLLSAHERTRPAGDLDVEIEARAEDVLPEQAALAALVDGEGQAFDGERVLGAAVDVALARADGPRADDHALEHRVRVALQDAAVHERAGVALIGVAQEVLAVGLCLGGELPLHARGEARAAAAAKARGLHGVDDPLRGHFQQRLRRGDVPAAADVLLDARGRDPALIVQYAQVLAREERDVGVVRDHGLGHGVAEHQPLHRAALQHVLLDQLGHVLGRELLVEVTARVHHQDRAAGAEAVAARGDHGDLARGARGIHVPDRHLVHELSRGQLLHQRLAHLLGSRGNAASAEAHQQVHACGLHERSPFPFAAASEGSLPIYTTYALAFLPAMVFWNTSRTFSASRCP